MVNKLMKKYSTSNVIQDTTTGMAKIQKQTTPNADKDVGQ